MVSGLKSRTFDVSGIEVLLPLVFCEGCTKDAVARTATQKNEASNRDFVVTVRMVAPILTDEPPFTQQGRVLPRVYLRPPGTFPGAAVAACFCSGVGAGGSGARLFKPSSLRNSASILAE